MISERLQELAALTKRWWLHLKRQPYTFSFGLLQPMVWFLLFGQLFKNSVRTPGVPEGRYLAFMTAGVIVLTTTLNGLMGGIEVIFDRETRVLHRFLVAPIGRWSFMWSRFIYVLATSLVQAALVLVVAHCFGVRVATGPVGMAVLLVMVGALTAGLTMISFMMAYTLRHHGEFFSIVGILNLPIMFLSSALMPLENMPGWMGLVARVNPMTFAIEAARSLMLFGWNGPLLAWCGTGLLLFNGVLMLWARRVFRRPLE